MLVRTEAEEEEKRLKAKRHPSHLRAVAYCKAGTREVPPAAPIALPRKSKTLHTQRYIRV